MISVGVLDRGAALGDCLARLIVPGAAPEPRVDVFICEQAYNRVCEYLRGDYSRAVEAPTVHGWTSLAFEALIWPLCRSFDGSGN